MNKTPMSALLRIKNALLWACLGSLTVLVFMVFLDEQEYMTIVAAGACCGVLRLLFPIDVFASMRPPAWLLLAGYLVIVYVWQMLQVFAFLTGKWSVFYTRVSLAAWDVVVFPASVITFFTALIVGGNFGEFVVFAAPVVNTMLLALVVGSVRRRRARMEQFSEPAI